MHLLESVVFGSVDVILCIVVLSSFQNVTSVNTVQLYWTFRIFFAFTLIGRHRALSIDIWPIQTICSVIGYSCVYITVVARDY